MKRGSTYTFNQSHSSNVGHPLRIKSDAGGQQTTTNTGTLGTDATVVYQPAYPLHLVILDIIAQYMVMLWVIQ